MYCQRDTFSTTAHLIYLSSRWLFSLFNRSSKQNWPYKVAIMSTRMNLTHYLPAEDSSYINNACSRNPHQAFYLSLWQVSSSCNSNATFLMRCWDSEWLLIVMMVNIETYRKYRTFKRPSRCLVCATWNAGEKVANDWKWWVCSYIKKKSLSW